MLEEVDPDAGLGVTGVVRMIKILFVDDELRLRRAWEKLFHAQSDFTLVGTLAQADDLNASVTACSPDIVVIDLTMPGVDPLLAIRDLGTSHPSVKAVVYSGRSEPEVLRESYDVGAWGYIDKIAPITDMFDTIRRVAAGEMVFPLTVTQAAQEVPQ